MQRLLAIVRVPPPWLWCADGQIWQRLVEGIWAVCPSNCCNNCTGGSSDPAICGVDHRLRGGPGLECLSFALVGSIAIAHPSWLGGGLWGAVGNRYPAVPQKAVSALHAERRRVARSTALQPIDKAALLGRPVALVRLISFFNGRRLLQRINRRRMTGGELRGSGVVLKPQRGHGGRGVVRFVGAMQGLQQALFRCLPDNEPLLRCAAPPAPQELLKHWQGLCQLGGRIGCAVFQTQHCIASNGAGCCGAGDHSWLPPTPVGIQSLVRSALG